MTPDDNPTGAPYPVPAVTVGLATVFDRLATIIRRGDPALASSAMDADLILRFGLPLGAVEQPGSPTAVPAAVGEPEALAREAVDLLDHEANQGTTAAQVLAGADAVERLVRALSGRDTTQAWLSARAERGRLR